MIWTWLTAAFIVFATTWLLSGIMISVPRLNTKYPIFKWTPIVGNIAILVFVIILWSSLGRPPLRTMAETRLWYSFFIAWTTWFIYLSTKDIVMYWLGFVMASVFLIVDIIHPEYQSKSLMPALQSPWFIPHVVIYMISYAVLGAAWLSSLIELYFKRAANDIINQSIKLVYIGFGLLTLGMLMGALWAKIAWGNYWSWDPKETWALLTWLFYLIAIHLHHSYPKATKLLLYLLVFSFVVLLITWFGIQYIAPGMQSVHIYGK